ncbi:unnamed protein product [Miscanthus lutarioriparius]|uniref:Uncharacterized protein n=1 Tax=Miscanthus lutarioriparius TaxID=422564 RepID=A0A811R640_9POAL|nr:unnamed protein product [Miscanthus lutarioriparius]
MDSSSTSLKPLLLSSNSRGGVVARTGIADSSACVDEAHRAAWRERKPVVVACWRRAAMAAVKLMAAAEARAAWQRAANRCLVQEDRKRAPKLACCPPSAEQHGTNNGNCRNSADRPICSLVPLRWNPMHSNLPPDFRWWVQSQPNFGIQKDIVSERLCSLGRDIHEKQVEDSAPPPKHEETLLCQAVDTSTEKIGDVLDPPWMVSSAFTKYSLETGLEEMKTVGSYSQVSKCIETLSTCLYKDNESPDFECIDRAPLKNPDKANFDMDAPWKGEKTRPWWQIADEDQLASLVAERATQHIENCDLPRPTQTCDHIECSYSTGSTDEVVLLYGNGVWEKHWRNDTYSVAQYFSSSSTTTLESKQTLRNASERDKILEALRHSQTRAREADMAAKKAHNEKDDVIKLLFRQASHLFACNQWLKIMQLENIVLQLKHKEHQIAAIIPELQWLTLKEKPTQGQEQRDWTRRKGRRQKKGGGFFDAILFAVGLGLAGAGFLLGWALGWLLPKL